MIVLVVKGEMKLTTRRILIVDDEPRLRATMDIIFKNAGYISNVAANAHEALETLRKNHFNVVLLDVKMPGVNGLQLLPEILHLYPGLPVVILTGYGTPEIASEAVRMGVKDYIQKPVEPANLLARLGDLMKREYPLARGNELAVKI